MVPPAGPGPTWVGVPLEPPAAGVPPPFAPPLPGVPVAPPAASPAEAPPVESTAVVSPPEPDGVVATPPDPDEVPPVKPPELAGGEVNPPVPDEEPPGVVEPPDPKVADCVPPVPVDAPGSLLLLPEQAIRPASANRGNKVRRCVVTMIVPHLPGAEFPTFNGANGYPFVSPQCGHEVLQTDRRRPCKTPTQRVSPPRDAWPWPVCVERGSRCTVRVIVTSVAPWAPLQARLPPLHESASRAPAPHSRLQARTCPLPTVGMVAATEVDVEVVALPSLAARWSRANRM